MSPPEQTVPQAQAIPSRRWSTEEARKLADIVSLADDLDFVVQACRRLQQFDQEEDLDPLLSRALFNVALIVYAVVLGHWGAS